MNAPTTDPNDIAVRVSRLEQDLSRSFERAIKLFQHSLTAFGVVLAIVGISIVAVGVQAWWTMNTQQELRRRMEEYLNRELEEAQRTIRMLPYRAFVTRGIEHLRRGNATQEDAAMWDEAIWKDLLDTLKAAQRESHFHDVAREFLRVIPYLKLDITREEFRPSYRGQLWICVILLESRIPEVIEAVHKVLPPSSRLNEIKRDCADDLRPEDRPDLSLVVDRLGQHRP